MYSGRRRVRRAVRRIASRAILVVASAGIALLALEAGLRIAGRMQGLDYRVYLQELVNPTHVPLRI